MVAPCSHSPAVDAPPACLLRGRADPDGFRLLATNASMTRTLADQFGAVEVRILGEGIGLPDPGEARALGIGMRGGCWRRDIMLLAGGQPRLLGRTLLPPAAVRLQRAVRRLGTRPLMELLFVRDRLRPDVMRLWRSFHLLRDGRLMRRTLFTVGGEPLLLTETQPVRLGASFAGSVP